MKKILKNRSKEIIKAIEPLPYFTINNLISIDKDRDYLKRLLYRLKKQNKIIAIKRGIYVHNIYLEEIKRKNLFSEYLEFIANIIYQPSYLSGEYVLQKYGILSELVNAFTLVSSKKTKKLFNKFGNFKYYHIKKELFVGFKSNQKDDFLIAEASLAKSLFDFLYFRKNILNSLEQIKELRLNLENLKQKDWQELKKYIEIEDSKKMRKILKNL